MFARRTTGHWKHLAVAMLLPLVISCSDNDTTGPASDPLVGTWQVTRFEAFDIDTEEDFELAEALLRTRRSVEPTQMAENDVLRGGRGLSK